MPRQTPDSYWSCDYCGIGGFRSMEEAKAHEADCQQAPPRKRQRSQQQYGDRRILLLEHGAPHGMSASDAVACQSIQVFEATPEQHAATTNQLGIRCVYCVHSSSQSQQPMAAVFPGGVDTIASSVKMIADRHVRTCPMAPQGVQDALSRPSSSQEDERALEDHCDAFCRRYGIVNRFPAKSGIVFGEQQQQQQGMMPMQPLDTIAATPLARRSKDPGASYEDPGSGYSAAFPHGPQFGGQGMAYGGGQEPAAGAAATPAARTLETASEHATPHQPTPHQETTPHHPGAYGMASPYEGHQQQQQSQQPIPTPNSFPFFQDHNGAWVCRYCSSLHPQYRDPGSVWQTPHQTPPPTHFIDQHLSMCRSYSQSMQQHPPMPPQGSWGSQHPPPPYYQHGMPPPQPPPPYGGGAGWSTPGMPPASTPGMPHHAPYAGGPPPDQGYPYAEHPGGMPQPHPETAPEGQPRPATPRTPATPSDAAVRAAIDHLVTTGQKLHSDSEEQLVLDEDKLLLTDYFYYLMKQLRLCRFSESDRKTRGGKRENIKVGYGGLQCVHCAEAPNSRKFFWSNVDRLANSFAEIPGHVLKCRRCPNQTKQALQELKQRHPEQMARLPRGSQKVFFRRMWRRLHDSDPQDEDAEQAAAAPLAAVAAAPAPADVPSPEESKASTSSSSKRDVASIETSQSSPGTSGDDLSIVVQRSTAEAAKALAASLREPPSPSSRILLAIPEDKEWLSDMDCFIRKNLEVFCATEEDVTLAQSDRKYPVSLGQVGIRCIHCALAKTGEGARGNAVAFPYSISGIYESVREFQRLHLESCPNLPKPVKAKLVGFKGSASLSSVLRKYYVLASKALGMYDTPDGIRSGAESVPLGSSAAFAFSETRVSEQMRMGGATPGGAGFIESGPMITPLESRKRKAAPPDTGDVAKPSAEGDEEKES